MKGMKNRRVKNKNKNDPFSATLLHPIEPVSRLPVLLTISYKNTRANRQITTLRNNTKRTSVPVESVGIRRESHVLVEYSSASFRGKFRVPLRQAKILAWWCTASGTIGSSSQTRCITKPTPSIPARSSLTRTNLRLINPRNWINDTAGAATLVDAGPGNTIRRNSSAGYRGKIIKIFLCRTTRKVALVTGYFWKTCSLYGETATRATWPIVYI